jgi:hypothetical protein
MCCTQRCCVSTWRWQHGLQDLATTMGHGGACLVSQLRSSSVSGNRLIWPELLQNSPSSIYCWQRLCGCHCLVRGGACWIHSGVLLLLLLLLLLLWLRRWWNLDFTWYAGWWHATMVLLTIGVAQLARERCLQVSLVYHRHVAGHAKHARLLGAVAHQWSCTPVCTGQPGQG